MAGRGPMCHCAHCLLIEEMKIIPESFLPQSAITELSKILDPIKDLADNDYRYFAEKNGLLPKDVQWLDSQKTQFRTSSIAKVLEHLYTRDGDRFTIYQVYKTLVKMNSDGQRIILNFMPEIRRLYNRGTRPGQEHAEPPSDIQPPPTNHDNPGHPPHYGDRSPSRSTHMEDGNSGSDLNNLNQGCLPQEISDFCGMNQDEASDPLRLRPGEGGDSGGAGGASSGCQVSFPADCRPENVSSTVDFRRGGREAQESSMPPSYEQSEREHNSRGVTAMCELKSPLPGPQVEVECQPDRAVDLNIPPLPSPQSQAGCQPDHGVYRNIPPSQQSISSSVQRQLPNFPLIDGRPGSFPSSQPPTPSYRNPGPSSRPKSDATTFCSHDGACNCFTSLSSSEAFSYISGEYTPSGVDVNAEDDHQESVSGSQWGRQWDKSQQTQVKTLDGGAEEAPSQQHHPMLTLELLARHDNMAQHNNRGTPDSDEHVINSPQRNQSGWTSSLIEEYNAKVEEQRPLRSSPSDPSSNFLFIVAGDLDNSTEFKQQVNDFRRSVENAGMSYILVHSFSHWPLVNLPQHVLDSLPPHACELKPIQKFIWKCFEQASRVVMLITPGYLRYADAYTEGVTEARTFQQKLTRKIQEKLKKEYFNKSKSFRIRPILLHQMKAVRTHLPVFLSSSVYYWFPAIANAEDVLKVLRNDLSNRSVTVKRSI